ncbi:MAG: hypothetical protein AAB131_21855, partial [Actinomycetota bacterium]
GAFSKYWEAGLETEWRGDNAYLRGSYVWSHYYGTFDQDNTSTAADNDANRFIGSSNIADGAGRQIWDFKNGDLRGDRRHQLKLFGYYRLPWNASVGAFGIYQSGQPWERHDVEVYRALLVRRLLTPNTGYLQFRLALERVVSTYDPVISFTYLQACSAAFEAVGISAYAHRFAGPRTMVRGTSGRLALQLTNRISTRQNVQIHVRVLPPRTGATVRLLSPSTIASIPSGGTVDVEMEVVAPTSATLGPIEIEVGVDDRLTPPGAIVIRHTLEIVPTPPPLPARLSWAIERTDDDGDHLWEFEESGTLTITYTNTETVPQEGVQVRILEVFVDSSNVERASALIPLGAAPAPVPTVDPGGEATFVMPFRLRADPHVVTAGGGTQREDTGISYYVEARDAAGRVAVRSYSYHPVYFRDQ